MRPFLTSVVVALVIAIGGALALSPAWNTPAYKAFTTDGARVAAPGDNLVGPTWSGQRNS